MNVLARRLRRALPYQNVFYTETEAVSFCSVARGHETTLNGFGVNLINVESDPFVRRWISETASLPHVQDKSATPCGLEIGTAFGSATLEALRRGAPCVLANDMEPQHLLVLRQRWDRLCEKKAPISAGSTSQALTRLVELPGIAPEALRRGVTSQYDVKTVLCANVLHFLRPSEVVTLLRQVRSLSSSTGTRLYVSLDSPWTAAYRLFWPMYQTRKWAVRSINPGAHAVWSIFRHVIPDRLRAMTYYHVMEPPALEHFLQQAGWEVEECRLFAGDCVGNPAGVSLGNGMEMVGAVARCGP